jgi:23S rRNA pseudouridine1911/1915/1917 synthase
MGLRIFYEDDDLIVLEKPAGILVHRTPKSSERTFLDEVREYFSKSPLKEEVRTNLVHRLDRGTSGLMIVARSTSAAKNLTQILRKIRPMDKVALCRILRKKLGININF